MFLLTLANILFARVEH